MALPVEITDTNYIATIKFTSLGLIVSGWIMWVSWDFFKVRRDLNFIVMEEFLLMKKKSQHYLWKLQIQTTLQPLSSLHWDLQ